MGQVVTGGSNIGDLSLSDYWVNGGERYALVIHAPGVPGDVSALLVNSLNGAVQPSAGVGSNGDVSLEFGGLNGPLRSFVGTAALTVQTQANIVGWELQDVGPQPGVVTVAGYPVNVVGSAPIAPPTFPSPPDLSWIKALALGLGAVLLVTWVVER